MRSSLKTRKNACSPKHDFLFNLKREAVYVLNVIGVYWYYIDILSNSGKWKCISVHFYKPKITRGASIMSRDAQRHMYRTQVRSLAMLVTHSLTHRLPFSKLDWCDPGMWRWQLKTCWSLVKILSLSLVEMKFEDLCKSWWYELNPRIRCAIGNVFQSR